MSIDDHEPRSLDGAGRSVTESPLLRLLRRPVAEADLQANGRLAAAAATGTTSARRTVVVFGLGGEHFALPASLLRRADSVARVRPVPHRRSSHLRGLCAVRGEMALCVDLRVVLDMPPVDEAARRTTAERRRMLVLGDAGRPWAVEVDDLVGVHSTEVAALRPAPITSSVGAAAFVDGLLDVEIGGNPRVVALLDAPRLLAAMERGLT